MTKKALTQDQSDMKLTNITTIFNLLYDKTPISRADLAKLSGMSPTSIGRLVNNILTLNLVCEMPSTEKKVGRTATILNINSKALYSVGININSLFVQVSILDFRKTIVATRYDEPSFASPTLDQMLDIAYDLYTELLSETGLSSTDICGIGMSIPGVMKDSEILDFTPQLKWKGMNIRKAIQERFQMENVIIANDCNSALIGQCVLHPEYKKHNVGCIYIGSGVGSAMNYSGAFFPNPNNAFFSEIGHTIVEPDGMLCDCGNRGCLQTYLAKGALIKRAQEYDSSVTSLKDIYQLWANDVPWAKALIQTACTYAKIAINNLACVYNPEIILIGGESIDAYWDMFKEILNEPQPFFEPFKGKMQIIPFFKGYESSIIGVSHQVQDFHLKKLLRSILSFKTKFLFHICQ